MKIYNNKKYNSITMYVLLIIAITLIMIIAIFEFQSVLNTFEKMIKISMPIIWGLIIAYLLNPVVKLFERIIGAVLFKKKPKKKLNRALSILFVDLFFIAIFVTLIIFVIPEIVYSVENFIRSLPDYLANLKKWGLGFLSDNPKLESYYNDEFDNISKYLEKTVTKFEPKLNEYASAFALGIFNFLIAIKNFVLGFIVSIYLIFSKDTLLAQCKKLLIAFLNKKTFRKASQIYHKSNEMFIGFIGGKIIDSFIIGVICFVGMTIFNMPFKTIISLIIGITNIIPFFGPFIGAIPTSLLILLANPRQFIWFLLFILLLQQFDGNILGPKILGDSTGLPAFWVLFSILIGGGLFGFMGMLLGVPTFAVFYAFLRINIENKLLAKKLPIETSAYYESSETILKRPETPFDYLSKDQISQINSSDNISTESLLQNNAVYIPKKHTKKKK